MPEENNSPAFAGDKKFGTSIFYAWDVKFRDYVVPKIPAWLEGYHLTLMTIPWCLIIIGASYLAKTNVHWLWVVSLAIFLQYITDLLDGALGRYRDTGTIKWGYYMDHFLDYMFLFSVLIGYALIMPDRYDYTIFFVMAILGAFMVNSYLDFAVTNRFKQFFLYIGPTEIRLLFIIINTLIIIFGKTYMSRVLPFVLALSFIGLCIVVYKTQKQIWEMDMVAKRKK